MRRASRAAASRDGCVPSGAALPSGAGGGAAAAASAVAPAMHEAAGFTSIVAVWRKCIAL